MNVVSWKVKELQAPHKRLAILHHLKQLKTEIALLQETNLSLEDFNRMHKLWVGQVYGSASVKGKAGVLILSHKNLPYEVLSGESDENGRVVIIKLKLFSRECILSNIYAPNSPSKPFFQGLTSRLAPYIHLSLLVGGDFNIVMHLLEDNSQGTASTDTPSQPANTPLMHFVDGLQLVDLWRVANPIGKEYLFLPTP